jgi:CRP-like cAMP-binding protein
MPKPVSCRRKSPRSPGIARAHDPLSNWLLAALPPIELQRWLPHLELIAMPAGLVLHEARTQETHVYFPTTAIVSKLYEMKDGDTAEIAVIGNEGLVGIAVLTGGSSTPNRAVVQSAGKGFRLNATTIKQEFDRAGPVTNVLLRYIQALMTQMAQTAVCNRHHSVDQQLCRWLLMGLDRLPGSELAITQALIASLLGVRREGVTEGAVRLQKAGVIRYSRGRISVLNRESLENRVCECYAVVKNEYDRLLPAAKSRPS